MDNNKLLRFLTDAIAIEEVDVAINISLALNQVMNSDIEPRTKEEILSRLKFLLSETQKHQKIFSKLTRELVQ